MGISDSLPVKPGTAKDNEIALAGIALRHVVEKFLLLVHFRFLYDEKAAGELLPQRLPKLVKILNII
jgi:hypothetical protein